MTQTTPHRVPEHLWKTNPALARAYGDVLRQYAGRATSWEQAFENLIEGFFKPQAGEDP